MRVTSYQKGFGLVELVVAMAVSVIVFYLLGDLLNYVNQSRRTIEQQSSAMSMRLAITTFLSDRATCDRNFGQTSGGAFDVAGNTPQPTQLVTADGAQVALQENSTYENNRLELIDIFVGNFLANGTVGVNQYRGVLDVTLVYRKTNSFIGSDQIAKTIKLSVELNGFSGRAPANEIRTCAAVGGETYSAWRETLNGHLVFNAPLGTGVGIGVNVPSQRLQVVGNILADKYIGPSDGRRKNKITPSQGIEILKNINGYKYRKKGSDNFEYGFLAQQVEEIMPEAVTTSPVTGLKAVDYRQVIAPLIESTKDIAKKNDEMKKIHERNQKKLKILRSELMRRGWLQESKSE